MQCGHRPTASWQGWQQRLVLLVLLWCSLSACQEQEEPVYYYVGCYTARTDLLKESVYAKTPQTCIEICEHQGHRYAVLAAEKCFCANQLEPQERQDEMLCHTRCLANKSQYCGGVGVHSYYSTTLLRQTAPHRLRVANRTANSISLAWDAYAPAKTVLPGGGAGGAPAQQITNFLIKCQVVHTYSTLPAFEQPEFIVQSSETSFELTDLQPATIYNISVRASCEQQQQQQQQREQSECGSATIKASTELGLPSPLPVEPKILARSGNTITVELAPVHNNNGPVTKLLIIVETVDDALSQPFDAEHLGSWQEAQQNGLPYYIAAELYYDRPEDNRTRQFVVGDNQRYGRYRNVPLEPLPGDDHQRAHVHISLGVVSTLDNITRTLYTHSSHEQHASSASPEEQQNGESSLLALTVTCVVFGCCLLLSIATYFYLRYKTCHSRVLHGRARIAHEMTQQTPIIERENNGYLLEEEELPPSLESFRQQLQTMLETLHRLPRGALQPNADDVIGDGHFGKVITGRLGTAEVVRDCALHAVRSPDQLSGSEQAKLLRALGQLRSLQRHELLLDFYGLSVSGECMFLVFELQRVNLKRRLIECRLASPAARLTTLTEQLVLQWMYELSSAMSYLGSCQVQHRQLSSHSVYVSADSKLKVSLFGSLHYPNSNRQRLDLGRWLAPEALRHQNHSTFKSDVWSFACVAWECCALGGTPYAHVASSQQLLEVIRAGVRPAQPAYVYGDLYQLLLNCWQLEPSERMGFEDVAFAVRQLMTSARHALCFDRLAGDTQDTLPLYLPMLETRT
ncbi:hypothetical protein KR222_009959 [Zaprionus bogoriensis]|nr:hypothetical protein KR222_009959 [Zaprionus bogoriensis]